MDFQDIFLPRYGAVAAHLSVTAFAYSIQSYYSQLFPLTVTVLRNVSALEDAGLFLGFTIVFITHKVL